MRCNLSPAPAASRSPYWGRCAWGFLLGVALLAGRAHAAEGIWISEAELQSRPMVGAAWSNLLETAKEPTPPPNLSDQEETTNVRILAKALVYARTGTPSYRTEVLGALQSITTGNSEQGTPDAPGRTLALGRNLAAYVIAADLVQLATVDAELDVAFRTKLRTLLTLDLDGRTLQSTHEDRPNNWGAMAGASRAAVAVYLGDTNELAQTARVLQGWLGDRTAYAGFSYHEDLSWQCDPSSPVGINPMGCEINGIDLGGALPEEMRRGGAFAWPPAPTPYPWEALQGLLVQAEILHRAGYDAWNWSDYALLRAALFLYAIQWPAEGDDEWQPWLINHVYGTAFPVETSRVRFGKIMGWTDWTHGTAAPRRAAPPLAFLQASVAAGLGSVHPPQVVAPIHSTIEITASAAPHFVFEAWTGAVHSTLSSIHVTLLEDVRLNAKFGEITTTNNVPHWWLAQYGLPTDDAAALDDPDGDGAKTWEEYFAGTNPTNAESFLSLSLEPLPSGALLLSWPSSPGRRYTLQSSPYWHDLAAGIEATPPTNSWVHVPAENMERYRVQLEL